MNNKGQSLVLFVLILPLILLIFVLVYDIGNMVLKRLELNNVSELVLDYGLDNIDRANITDDMKKMVEKNIKDIDYVDIILDDGKIYITLKENFDRSLGLIKDIQFFEIKSSYVGYFLEGRKRVERNK